MKPALLDVMQDITAPDNLEIIVRADGKVIWVNIDGRCVLRACRIRHLTLSDRRK